MEHSLVILKPDGVNKKILFEVVKRFNDDGLVVSNLKEMELNADLIKEHYCHLVNKPFYKSIEKYMLSGVVVLMIVSGENAIVKIREIIGETNSSKALPNTIRGMYGDKEKIERNVIHASDSRMNAILEIKRFYGNEFNLINEENFVYQKRRVK